MISNEARESRPTSSKVALSYARPGTAKELTPIAQFLLMPVGWFMLTATILLAMWTLWDQRQPGADFVAWMLRSAAWLLIGIVWIIRVLSREILIYTRRPPRDLCPPGRWRSVAVALIALGTLVLSLNDVPLRIALAVSDRAMTKLAARGAAAAPGEIFPDQRVGIYFADDVQAIPGGVRFITGNGFIDRYGLAFSPSGPPPSLNGEDSYTPLKGDWYVWREGW